MKEITVDAEIGSLDRVLDFIRQELKTAGCDARAEIQITIAAEEIFTNIAHYAYNPKLGLATVRCAVSDQPLEVTLQFLDNGVPYNPLEAADPDITVSAEQREIGGLGIFMVKKSMDSIDYAYHDGKNILTIRKNLHR
ncbi:MAG: ATP-binding protein [Victivallaceae bacterium]|nr:ATP-binding protein [Victivallaceae bacterium]